jgi:hypothetical protein
MRYMNAELPGLTITRAETNLCVSGWRAENDEAENYVYAIALHDPPK